MLDIQIDAIDAELAVSFSLPTGNQSINQPTHPPFVYTRRDLGTDDRFLSNSCTNYPPPDHHLPRFPALCWPPHACVIYSVYDSWRFTLTWTLILFIAFHLSATAIALLMQVGKPRSIWKYLVAIPIVYTVIAGVEALVTGSVVGSM